MQSKTGFRRQKKRVERDYVESMNKIEIGIVKLNAPNRIRVLNSEILENRSNMIEICDTTEAGIWTEISDPVKLNTVTGVVKIGTA